MTGVTAIMAGMGGRAPLVVTAADVFGAGTAPDTIISNTPGTTVTGGLPPYTYSWTRVSGSVTPVPNATNIQNPSWSAFINDPSTSLSAVWRVTVNDSGGATPATRDINVTLDTL